jgi:cell division cycle 20-like protein 1 (cofactor of APC complex)
MSCQHQTGVCFCIGGCRSRVGVMAWGSSVLSSGSRDRSILQRDVRAAEPLVARLAGHRSEVCGLKVRQASSQGS